MSINIIVKFAWKEILAVGATLTALVLASKVDKSDAAECLNNLVNKGKEKINNLAEEHIIDAEDVEEAV